jgi:hypothetical protein
MALLGFFLQVIEIEPRILAALLHGTTLHEPMEPQKTSSL